MSYQVQIIIFITSANILYKMLFYLNLYLLIIDNIE